MKENLGRNDLCYCGSNRKYKDCHLRPFYPAEYFFCKIMEFDTIKYENRLPPQFFEIDRADIYYRNPYPWDHTISKLLVSLTGFPWKESDRWHNRIKKRINKIHHKLDAVKYHIESFKTHELKTETDYKNYIVANTTMNKIYDDPSLIYNFESFLFQSKSCMDVLAQIIAYSFKFETSTYRNKGDDLIKELKKIQNENASKVIGVIQGARNWVNELVEMRDEVTHFSDLEGLSCFLTAQSKDTDEIVKVFYPSVPSGERVSKYMDKTWTNVSHLISKCAQLLVDTAKK